MQLLTCSKLLILTIYQYCPKNNVDIKIYADNTEYIKDQTKSLEANMTQQNNPIPEFGYLRLRQILGDPNANPPIPPIIPISRSSWYQGIRAKKYPAPSKKFGVRTSVWDVRAIRALLDDVA